MGVSISTIADSAFPQMFRGLSGVLAKGAAFAETKRIDESVLLGWRMAPDMFPLSRQVQIATELPARGLARLARVDVPSFPDTEKTFADLHNRIATVADYLSTLDRAAIDADPDGTVTFPTGGSEMTMNRVQYFAEFVLPNLYFHVTTSYAILRACGVEIGKRDFLAVAG